MKAISKIAALQSSRGYYRELNSKSHNRNGDASCDVPLLTVLLLLEVMLTPQLW
jgi:hypothetical protein